MIDDKPTKGMFDCSSREECAV